MYDDYLSEGNKKSFQALSIQPSKGFEPFEGYQE